MEPGAPLAPRLCAFGRLWLTPSQLYQRPVGRLRYIAPPSASPSPPGVLLFVVDGVDAWFGSAAQTLSLKGEPIGRGGVSFSVRATAVARLMLVDAALCRDEVAWSSYTALNALAFIVRDDLIREMVTITRHTLTETSSNAGAPMVSESLVAEFLKLQGVGIPEGYNEFVVLHNRLIDWVIERAVHGTEQRSLRFSSSSADSTSGATLLSEGHSAPRSTSPPGRSISHAATFHVRTWPRYLLPLSEANSGPAHDDSASPTHYSPHRSTYSLHLCTSDEALLDWTIDPTAQAPHP